MSVTKEQRHFLVGRARSGVYDAAKIYSAWLQFRARALLARPSAYLYASPHVYRARAKLGSWQLPVMGCSWHGVKQRS